MKTNQSTRRDFLGKTVATSAAIATSVTVPTIISSKVFANKSRVAPSDKLSLGVVGIGPRCTYDLKSMLQLSDVQCVAISDVQQSRRDAGKKLVDDHYGNKDCDLHQDFRELLAREDIDTVIVATGDRWHATASMLAADAGKDVYSEKPCGISVELCQQLADKFDKTKRVFQAGTQRRSVPNFHQAAKLAHEGHLGKLEKLYASVYFPVLDNAWLPAEPTPAREVCDWNMWLGPAPWRPYNSKYVAGRWRGIHDFDSGARLLDWGAHTVDLCQWANQSDDTMPIEYVPSEKNIECKYENGVTLVIDFIKDPFGNRGPNWITRLGTCPVRFVGSEGWVETGDSGEIVVEPKSLAGKIDTDYKRIRGLDVTAHSRNFFDCVKSRDLPAANHHVMRRSHIASHAAAIAWMLQRKLTLDPKTEKFVDDPEANHLCSRAARNWA